MTDSTGAVKSQYVYGPFGQVSQIAGSASADFLFDAYYQHAQSGLLLTRTRAYSATSGRFLNRDRAGETFGPNLTVVPEGQVQVLAQELELERVVARQAVQTVVLSIHLSVIRVRVFRQQRGQILIHLWMRSFLVA